ncbi:MAG: nucleotide-binding protein, partial [Rhodoferax sp.]|nr:nucleotide-binding protein [Rhodoferax sp.]
MKNQRHLLFASLFLAGTLTYASAPASPKTLSGIVLETQDVEIYTYVRLKTSQGESWAAVSRAPVKKGSTVTLENVNEMQNFESKTLKKTFPVIYFGNLAGSGAAATTSDPHAAMRKAESAGPIKVAKASGANAFTVAELVTGAARLKDKPVRLSAKVVKYNPGIMGKNWIHLQDGTGQEADNSLDILVTSTSEARLGE